LYPSVGGCVKEKRKSLLGAAKINKGISGQTNRKQKASRLAFPFRGRWREAPDEGEG
jgi:hypothetical protein